MTVSCSSLENVSLPLRYDDSLNCSAVVGDSVEILSQNDINLNESSDYDRDSMISVSETNLVTANLHSDTSFSDLDISLQYREGVRISCIVNMLFHFWYHFFCDSRKLVLVCVREVI